MGKTPRGALSNAEKQDLEALVDALPRMPADLREGLRNDAHELKNLLIAESDSKEWHRKLSNTIFKINQDQSKVLEARLVKHHPNLKDLDNEKKTIEQMAIENKYAGNIANQILEAKNAQHPNWKRVESIFEKVRSDLIAEVQAATDSESERKGAKNILLGVHFTLYPTVIAIA